MGSFQNRAICVWSVVRVVLSTRPRLLTSLKAAAYSGLSSAGGGRGRNRAPSVMAKGVTWGHWGPSAGKYAGSVTPSPQGTITALSPSPKDVNILWAGTDDGNIQVTLDGGVGWTNVTPPEIKPWTRIFNIEAGHFDTRTAYAAANTLRIDDLNPHFWRTHDAGKTWTEINTGIAAGAAANSIRLLLPRPSAGSCAASLRM